MEDSGSDLEAPEPPSGAPSPRMETAETAENEPDPEKKVVRRFRCTPRKCFGLLRRCFFSSRLDPVLARPPWEEDDGVLFGVRGTHLRAQLNLTLLTFGCTATVSALLLIFAALMLALRSLDDTEFQTYKDLLIFIAAAWLPSPTVLLKGKRK